ncbi:MAG: D-glycero-beta-D-manno-heptose-7-phosphate kinase [Candidatus Zixiibacteriota bacterium]
MKKISKQSFERIFSSLGSHKILILGDVMLDEYLWGSVSRISPEAPVPVVEILKETVKLGGAANVALNVQALGDQPVLVGIVGKDKNGERVKDILKDNQLQGEGIFVDQDRHTTIKTRIIAHSQQIVRADREKTDEISPELSSKLFDFIQSRVRDIKGIIISDYGKGVINGGLLQRVIALAKDNDLFIGVDPKESHFMSYKQVSVITPNHHEASFVFGKRIKDEGSLKEVGWGLLERLDVESLLITRGEKGMSLFEKNKTLTHFPTVAKEVYDVTGAGDTVISAFACARAAGADFKEAALLSNHAAGIAVGELGTAQVTKQRLKDDLKDFVE